MLGVIETTVQACATFDTQRICQWSGFVRIRLCSAFSERFYIYRLPVPPGCPLSYCVDAASRGSCTPPEVWISNEYRCGGLNHSNLNAVMHDRYYQYTSRVEWSNHVLKILCVIPNGYHKVVSVKLLLLSLSTTEVPKSWPTGNLLTASSQNVIREAARFNVMTDCFYSFRISLLKVRNDIAQLFNIQ